MERGKITLQDKDLFFLFFVFWAIWAWISFISSWIGIFSAIYNLAFLALSISILGFLLWKKRIVILMKPATLMVIFIGLFFSFLSPYFSTESIFTGRDQGAISEAAIRLADNKKIYFESAEAKVFFDIYGPGKALNFPGFYYTEKGALTTHFPLPYISWLATFYDIFGLAGLRIANIVLLFIFSLAFFQCLQILANNYLASLLGQVTALCSFTTFWFAKYTLTENMTLAFLWVGIFYLLIFVNAPNKKNWAVVFTIFSLLMFVRIEGLFFMFAFLLFVLIHPACRKWLKKENKILTFWPIAFIVFVLLFYVATSKPYFKEVIKGFLNYNGRINISRIFEVPYGGIWQVIYAYGLAIYFLLGFIGLIYAALKKKTQWLMPLFLTWPTFIYIILPKISFDHPWMLRRYSFSVVPFFILLSILLISEISIFRKKLNLLMFWLIIFLSFNLPVFGNYAFFSENSGLLNQTKTLADQFDKNALILVDPLASGDGWSMISGPLSSIFGLKAAYFFNPGDYFKLNTSAFSTVYLIAPNERTNFYTSSELGPRLKLASTYSFSTTRLSTEKNIVPARKTKSQVTGYIYEIVAWSKPNN